MKVFARSWPAVGSTLLFWLVSACGNQGVGERCDIKNLSLDCDDGLMCLGVNTNYGLCCPQAGSSVATPAVCLTQGTANPTPDASADGSTSDGGALSEAGEASETGTTD